MSARSDHWCWAQEDVSPAELLLMLAISDRCDEDGKGSFQSVETLAAKSHMSDRNVRRLITDLETRGKCKRIERPSRTTEVHLLIPEDFGRRKKADKLSGSDPDKVAGQGESSDPAKLAGNPAKLAAREDKLAADSSPPIFPSQNTKDARPRATPGRSPGRAGESPPEPDVAALNATAAELQLEPRPPSESLQAYQRRVGDAQRQLRYLEGRAVALRVTRRFPDEPLGRFETRINAAETEALARQAAQYSAERAAERRATETVQ